MNELGYGGGSLLEELYTVITFPLLVKKEKKR